MVVGDATRAAITYLIGKTQHICRLCLSYTNDKYLSLDEDVKIKKEFFEETITLWDILKDLSVPQEPCLPLILCTDCAKMATTSYLFKNLCKYSSDTWNFAVDRLYIRLNQNIAESSVNTAYLMINEDKNVVIRNIKQPKTKTRKSASKYKYTLTKKGKSVRKSTAPLICDECGKSFKTTSHLRKHVATHSKDLFTCSECFKVFTAKFKLDYHTERVHLPKTIQCSKCPKMFTTSYFLKKHDTEFHQAALCKFCFIQLPSKHLLQKHLSAHETHQCQMCSKSFSTKDSFRLHLKICGVDRQPNFFCDICNKGYARKNGLRTHLKVDHGFGNVLSCKWCNKKYDSISQLKIHQVKHTKEKNYYCEHCGGKFVTHAALVCHVRLHTGEKPYQCDLCDESFLSASRRMDHKRRKHFAPSKECEVCHTKFVTNFQLRKHMKCHLNPKSKLFVPNALFTTLLDGKKGQEDDIYA